MAGTTSTDPHVQAAAEYARGVIRGSVPACRWVKLACKRQVHDLKQARKRDFPYRFDEAAAARVCRFVERLPHIKGKWARKLPGGKQPTITLEPWQCFILTTIFGWVRKADGRRRYRQAYICVPRKNGKSILAAAIGLYMLVADREIGAEVYSGATSEKQAGEVFEPAFKMVQQTVGLADHYQLETSGTWKNPQAIYSLRSGSSFKRVIGKPGDGSSPSLAIVDEYHEHKTDDMVDTMLTGMGAREQPLLLVITTAGSDTAGPCYAYQQDVQSVLEGVISNDELFGIIYSIDEGDDWTSEKALRKANPNFGISVDGDILRAALRDALANSRYQSRYKTKHLNVWVGARDPFFNHDQWLQLADPTLTLAQFADEECYAGLDLASKIDIASVALVFRREVDGNEHYYVFARHYLPEARALDPDCRHYVGWVADGALIATGEEMIDHGRIRDDLLDDAGEYTLVEVGFDPYNATQLAGELLAEGIAAVEVPMRARHLSDPMKYLDGLIRAKRIHHNGDPVLSWMMGNVTAKLDANDNVFPRKERVENKIDGAVALIIAMSRALAGEQNASVYESRGVLYLE